MTIASPAVSVVMTVYNREQYVAPAIESVLAQTFTDFELIIVDDRSTDRSLEIVNGYARRDGRIHVSVNERNLGQFANRRKAASLARGEYLKYHDSDDMMYPHCLATMIAGLNAEPRAGFALSGSRCWPGGPCPMLLTPKLAYEREFLGAGLFHLGPASALFRSQVFRDLGGFPDAGIASDYLFWMTACARVNVLLVPADLFYYRIHANQQLTAPASQLEYAKASGMAWPMLNSPECPLDGADREQAKRNWAYVVARGARRRARRGQFRAAFDVIRYSRLGVTDWLRYLRPSRRDVFAGTPSIDGPQIS